MGPLDTFVARARAYGQSHLAGQPRVNAYQQPEYYFFDPEDDEDV
jgi:hypothetical protein